MLLWQMKYKIAYKKVVYTKHMDGGDDTLIPKTLALHFSLIL